MLVDVSVAEFLDKISILEIKKNKISNKDKLKNINKELEYLKNKKKEIQPINDELILELNKVNLDLWEIEEQIRVKEKEKSFDDEFINLARNVYILNDKRALIKKNINIESQSIFIEEKSYEK
jgi:hypothetical protein